MLRFAKIPSPFGKLLVAADEKGLVSLSFPGSWDARGLPKDGGADRKLFRETEAALKAYFDRRKVLPKIARGALTGTDFQRKVWAAIEKIPFGETRSYGEIAEAIGHPRAARAVGTACGANPLPLFVPCHRVLAARGAIGGYGPTGIDVKKKLLRIEGSW